MQIDPIAYFHSPFPTKFGIPKQSGLVESLKGTIVFEPDYRDVHALRGIEGFDYLWLIWQFNANSHQSESLVVRPPVLGGNDKVGVFASRSPYRPNGLGLSSVRLSAVDWDTPQGTVLHVLGADLMDGTPIFDIKPYLAYADSHEEARSGFTGAEHIHRLDVVVPPEVARGLPADQMETLRRVLSLDPRPAYQNSPKKVYGMPYEGHDVHFIVEGNELRVLDLG